MCFVVFMAIGAFAITLWMHGNVLYAALAGAVSLLFLVFFIRKMVRNAPCLFGGKEDCS